MKKYICLLLSLILAFSLLAGCAKQTADTPASSGTETPAQTAGETVTLKFIGWRTEDEAAINAMNEKFTAENPNIKVIYEQISATEYDT